MIKNVREYGVETCRKFQNMQIMLVGLDTDLQHNALNLLQFLLVINEQNYYQRTEP